MSPVYRHTQRAPLSCTSCAARKVRCSKDIPCRACVSRGSAAECRRERVVVRGRIRTADIPASSPSNADLQLENSRLAALVSTIDAIDEPELSTIDLTEHYEKNLHVAVGQSEEKRTVLSIEDIIMPSMDCSTYLIKFAELWTSWIHYALFFPYFCDEHAQFWSEGGSLTSREPLWLAVYFSVLSSTLILMDNEEFLQCDPPFGLQDALLKNWYDAALYLLDTADFMQKSDIRIVRVIVILGMVATNAGDTNRHANLWACGIRIAQQLNLGSDRANFSESAVQRESRRRLWWTLVLCEWIPIPGRAPCVNDIDFDCQLPSDIDDRQLLHSIRGRIAVEKQEARPVQYHIVMCKIAIICYQLRSKIRLRRWYASEISVFVLEADDQLAGLIDQLPPHLQNDETETPETRNRDSNQPWIPYQKLSLAMVILYYRLAINRILQSHWLEGSTDYTRARSVCLSSAMGIVNSAVTRSTSSSRMRSWSVIQIISHF
ncbi:Nn.00g060570.m01.CDS01 [Neocucurbitaria sp. VM-36]